MKYLNYFNTTQDYIEKEGELYALKYFVAYDKEAKKIHVKYYTTVSYNDNSLLFNNNAYINNNVLFVNGANIEYNNNTLIIN